MPKHAVQLIPFAVGLVLAACIAAGLHVDQQHFEQKSRLAAMDKLAAIRGCLENALHARVNRIGGLETFIRLVPNPDDRAFAVLAEGLTAGADGIRLVALAEKNTISHVYPANAAGLWLGRDVFRNCPAPVRELAHRALRVRQLRVAAPPPGRNEPEVVLAVAPFFHGEDNHYWGLALMVVDAAALFREAGLANAPAGLRIALRAAGPAGARPRELYGAATVFDQNPVEFSIPVPGGDWRLAAVPVGGWGASPNRAAILYLGGGAALLVTGLLFSTLFLLVSRLRERDEYRRLMDHAKNLILRMDLAGDITYCNEYGEDFYGYARGELVGRPLVGTLVPSGSPTGDALGRHLGNLLENPSALPFSEFLTVCRNGEAVWVSWTHEPVLDASGDMIGLLSVGTNITDRKFMEEALRQRERQYRLLAENVTDVIFGLDADLHYTFVSPSDATARGVKRADVLGRPLADQLKPASRSRFQDAVERLGRLPDQGQESAIVDLEFLCAGGATLWLETRLGPMHNDDGHIIGVLGVGRDITDRKLAEALREDMERMARHDLKTPLGAVIALPAEIRRMSVLDPLQNELLDTIEQAGRAMLRHINGSLDLYKMEQGDYPLRREPIDVLEIIEEIKAESLPLIREKGVSMGVEALNGDGKRCEAEVEPPLFRSMLGNLLRNALTASPEGGVVTVTLARGDSLSITIRNQGEVPPSIRDVFFEKYVTAGNGNGSGLGTYSARLIARTHGGDISLDTSSPGRTSITVTLPGQGA